MTMVPPMLPKPRPMPKRQPKPKPAATMDLTIVDCVAIPAASVCCRPTVDAVSAVASSRKPARLWAGGETPRKLIRFLKEAKLKIASQMQARMSRKLGQIAVLSVVGQVGCLIPIPLEQQVTTDGGLSLQVKAAIPPFGTQRATSILEKYTYQVDVVTGSADVAARLYLQINGTCCDLNIDNPNVTRWSQQAQAQAVDATTGSYSMVFSQPVLPCTMVPAGAIVYVVPVIASGGFADFQMGVRPDGLGEVDRSHYWTVICP